MVRTVEYYRTGDGKCPVEDFLATLSAKEQARVFWVLKLLEDLDLVPKEYFKKLVGTDEIWECRVQAGSNAYRLFSFFFRGDKIILTHGYSKKSMKTDAREIRRAEKYRQDFLSRQKGN